MNSKRNASVRSDRPDERRDSARTCVASDVCLRICLQRLESCKPQHHLPQPLWSPHSLSGFKVPSSGDIYAPQEEKRRTGSNKVRVQPRCAANPKSEAQSRHKAAQLRVSEPECVCVSVSVDMCVSVCGGRKQRCGFISTEDVSMSHCRGS